MTAIEVVTQTTSQPIKIARSWSMYGAEEATRVQEHDDLEFDDLLDLINPLHHVPIVGTIYRAITGDEIKPEMQVSGDLLFGIVSGNVLLSGVMSVASLIYEQENGQDPLTHIAQALFGGDTVQPPSPEAGHVQLALAPLGGVPNTLFGKNTVQSPLPEAGYVQFASASVGEVETAPLGGVTNTLFGKNTVQSPLPEAGYVQFVAPTVAGTVGRAPVATVLEASDSLPKAESFVKKQEITNAEQAAVQQKDQIDSQMDAPTLAQKMQQQATAHRAGAALPPNLVHDMMLMALDKYKTAQTMAPDAQSIIQ